MKNNYSEFKKYLGKPKKCAICGSLKKKSWAKVSIFKAVECCRCGLVWIDPFLTEKGLDYYYCNYIQHRLEDKNNLHLREKMYKIDKDYLEKFVSSGRLLDIGCNGGFFLSKLNNKFKKFGIDIDIKAVEHAKNNFAFGKNIKCCKLGKDDFPEGYFDVVTMRGVIEHFSDPLNVIKNVARLLKNNGYFYIAATPNVDCFCAYLYREKWRMFLPIQHLYYFSIKTLTKLVRKVNLRVISVDYPYLETPYADSKNDYEKVLKDHHLIINGKRNLVNNSPAFWGSMMTVVMQKQ